MSLNYQHITLFAAFEGTTYVKEQAVGPVITESQAPSSGSWAWIVSDLTGFTNDPNFQFTLLNGNGTQARLTWDANAIDNADWLASGGFEGSFTLILRHTGDSDIVYQVGVNPFQISLRHLDVAEFTVFKGQTGGGPAVSSGTYGFAVSPGSYTGIDSSLVLDFTSSGAISVSDPGTVAWTEDGTFTLRITPGAGPYCDIAGMPLHLRALTTTEFTVFKGQTGGGPAVSSGTYGFAVSPGSYTGIDSSLVLDFTSSGAISVSDPGTVAWTEDGTFTLRITPSTGPYCDIGGLGLHLRKLKSNDFTVFQGQTGGGDMLPETDPGTYSFAVAPGSYGGGIPADLDLAFNNKGAISVADPGSAVFSEDGTFTLRVTPTAGPYCDMGGLGMHLRRLSNTTFYWFDNQTAVDFTTINGDPSGASYDWSSSDARVVISNGGGTRIGEQITCSGVDAGTDVDFNLIITDGTHPESHIPCTLKARHVTDPINITYSESSGSETVEVTGDTVTVWNFGTGVFSGIESVLSFNDGVGNTASISWGDDALINDDSGTLTFTIQPNDASAPSCTVLVNVNISVTTNIVDITKPTVIDCTFEIV